MNASDNKEAPPAKRARVKMEVKEDECKEEPGKEKQGEGNKADRHTAEVLGTQGRSPEFNV